jgi:hypothetical protein
MYDERSEGFVFSESDKEAFDVEYSLDSRGEADLLLEVLRDNKDMDLRLMRIIVHDFHEREGRTSREDWQSLGAHSRCCERCCSVASLPKRKLEALHGAHQAEIQVEGQPTKEPI